MREGERGREGGKEKERERERERERDRDRETEKGEREEKEREKGNEGSLSRTCLGKPAFFVLGRQV